MSRATASPWKSARFTDPLHRGVRVAAAVAAALASARTALANPDAAAHELFESRVRPVLVEKCFDCHSGQARSLKANLLLDSREGLLRGGDSGAAITPGAPQQSLLIKALRSTDADAAMPPKKAGGQLSEAVIADFERWIAAGAPWPGGGAAASSKQFDLAKRKQEHWCWKAPVKHAPPKTSRPDWVRSTVDAFILAKLESAGLEPGPGADRSVLLRRLYFDLTGLPPSREEAEAFLGDHRPDAVERLVDGLLASPHFGERWARHWMDLVRYGESRGHELDAPAPNVWQYRDYLVRAFNADVPYNQFVTEHLAGDLIPQRRDPKTGACESLLGTGFWFLGEEVHSPVDPRQDELDRVDNQVDVMSKTFLGVTVACARCHDHKFDAISQRDYYALCGFVLSSNRRQVRFETLEKDATVSRDLEAWRAGARPALLRAAADSMRPSILECVQTIQASRSAKPGQNGESGGDRASAWRKALEHARATPEDPLHPVADALLQPPDAQPGAVRAALDRALKRLPQPEKEERSWRIIADFRTTQPTHWAQDGSAFGAGPLRAGEPLLGTAPERPLAGLLTLTAARRDPAFLGLVAKGAPNSGVLKNIQASGQMLRTPEFDIQTGHLAYLLRGGAKIFAPINSHHFVQGPLHGKTVLTAKVSPQWQWVRHDMSPYAGLRTHVEFAPDGDNELEIAVVMESTASPGQPVSEPPALQSVPGLLAKMLLAGELPGTAEDLAAVLRRAFEKAVDAMSQDALGESDTAPLADWMVRHWELFGPGAEKERRALAAASQPHLEGWRKIRDSVQKESAVAMAIMDGSGTDEWQLKRGSPRLPLQPVPRRMLEAIAGPEPMDCGKGSGRLKLAEQIASASNPLTARVIVNRVWHHLFGRGIVASVDNFGVLGQAPSHPELLDTLAVEFVTTQGWSLKKLIRSLVLSRVYQTGSQPLDRVAEEKDPENTLLHRMNLRRLEGEAIRDAILSVSGALNRQLGGPSIPVHLTQFMDGRGRPQQGPLDGAGRRSVYISVIRNFLSPMMLAFDTPIPFNTIGRRNVSNVPSQALMLMNDPFVVECAKKWALRLNPTPEPERLRDMYLTAFSREPLPDEAREAAGFTREQAALLGVESTNDPRIWADLAHVLITTKEFIHLQ